MADTSDDDFLLREIDEELQQEKYSELWKVYGNYIIAVILVIVLGVGGYQGWRSYDLSARHEQSVRFAAAMNAIAEKPEDARKTFAKIAEGAKGGCPVSRVLNAEITMDAKLA